MYKIEHVDEKVVKFETLEHEFSYDEVREMMRLSFARTLQSCQGVEFDEPLTLHELGHRFILCGTCLWACRRLRTRIWCIARCERDPKLSP